EFYTACRNNDIDTAQRLIVTMTVDDINRFELTRHGRSTALHAACFFGHIEIVQLLLKYKADRTLRNAFDFTPYDEAGRREIKFLLRNPFSTADGASSHNRFVPETCDIEWLSVGDEVIKKARKYRGKLKTLSFNLPYGIDSIIHDYLESDELRNSAGIDEVKQLFRLTAKEDDPRHVIRAYTLETAFYTRFNEEVKFIYSVVSKKTVTVSVLSLFQNQKNFF
ncbi:unnamed protein product, partial [Didymodactylos carnosus]